MTQLSLAMQRLSASAMRPLSTLHHAGGNVVTRVSPVNFHQYETAEADVAHRCRQALSFALTMEPKDYFRAYRNMIATADDSVVNWWYSGWTFVQIPGEPEIPIMQVTAIMTYRTETLADNVFRVHWSEIGAFRDPATGEVPGEWHNPLSGALVLPPKSFVEGPGTLTVTATPIGVQLEIVQPHATVQETSVNFDVVHGRLKVTQQERKLRGFPAADGRLPPPGSASGSEGITELCFFAEVARLAHPEVESVPVQGTYSFLLKGLVPWMGFGNLAGQTVTRGLISRAPPGHQLDAAAWQRLATLFPEEIDNPVAARR